VARYVPRVSWKQTKIILVRTEINQNKICFGFFPDSFVKPKRKNVGLFRCFEPISKQPKQTNLFRNKPKQTETILNFMKNSQIYSLLNCFGRVFCLFWFNQNSLFRYRSETTETNCLEKQTEKTKKTKKRKKTEKTEKRKNRKNPKFSVKNNKICSLSNCFGWSSACFGSIKTSKLSFSV
jgi:hypothetical protein